jgi:hypothetical protein
MGIFSTRIAAQGGPPMITDDTETVPKGHWEINTAFTIERGADDRLFGTPLLDVNYGLSEHMQFKAEMPWLVLHRNGQSSVNGPGNLNIGIRWRFRDEKEHHRIAMSIYPQFEFNTLKASTNRGLVDKGPELFLPLQWQTRIGKFGLGGDAGYRFRRGADEVTYGVILGRELNERLEVMGEIHSSGVLRQLEESETVFNLGSRVKLTKHTKLLVSAGRSLRPGRDPQFIGYAGLQVNF